MTPQYIHTFDSPLKDRMQLGGKGASLARMTGTLGLPVPPGFTITTEAWKVFAKDEPVVPPVLADNITRHLVELATRLDNELDSSESPLLLSVRSGAAQSMPGMMDTVLNVGMSDSVVVGVAARTSERFAWQSYARLLATFADVVRELPADVLARVHAQADDADDREKVRLWKEAIEQHGAPFPQTAVGQVLESVEAVWRSWNRPRAQRYRKYRGIPDDLGTAVTVQGMVFGNLDNDSGTGVVFTRDPATGEPTAYGDFMRCAQGEDVVNGSQIPESIESLRIQSPEAWKALQDALAKLEQEYTDMCDVEFTIQHGRLWILQARVGQRSPAAAVRIAVDLVDQGMIDIDAALDRVPLSALEMLQAPVCESFEGLTELGVGVPASPGTAVGPAVLDSARAEEWAEQGTAPVLICPTTSPQDISGMIASSGIVTALGGRASHAAVVARGMGKPASCGVAGMSIDQVGRTVSFPSGAVIREGDLITVSGDDGRVLLGAAAFSDPVPNPWLSRLLDWCDERSQVPVLDGPRADLDVIGAPEDVDEDPGSVLIDVPWEGADSAALLTRTCDRVFEVTGAESEVFIALPRNLAGIDFRPSGGPWAGIVADGDNSWAARLLSARLVGSAR